MSKKLFYYCISYEITMSSTTTENTDTDFLIVNQTPLDGKLQKEKLQWYHYQNNIPYSEIKITNSKELTEKEYYIRTRYL